MALSLRSVRGCAPVSRTSASRVVVARPSVRRTVKVTALVGGGKEGGGGNPFDMKNLMESVKKAQGMVQQETQRVQQELAVTEFDGYDEEETVRVIMTGNQEPKSVDITQDAVDSGVEELNRRVLLAMKDAHLKSVAGMKEKMQQLAKNLGIPGGMPGMGQ